MLTSVVLVVTYMILSGMAYPQIHRRRVKNCPWTGHEVGPRLNSVTQACEQHHKPEAVVLSVLGPLVLPFLLGAAITDRQSRTESRRAKELAEANHRLELAKIERKQLKELENNLLRDGS